MAEKNIGKITQIISAVLDIKFSEGNLPEINEAIKIEKEDGSLTVEVAQHLGDDTVRCIAMGPTDGLSGCTALVYTITSKLSVILLRLCP